MDLQSVCRDVMDDVDGSLGCVLTDLETGLPLAAEYRAGTVMNANTITLVSYVGIDLFRGKLVRNFERSLSRNREGSGGFVREVQMTTTNTYQFMSSVPGWEQVVFILVTNRNVSLGMGLLAVHDAVRRFREIPRRAFAPAVNPTFRPREEASEPSTPTLTQPLEQRRTEPQRDSTFDAPERPEAARERTLDAPEQREAARERTFEAPEQREPTRERKLETPQPPDTGSEPQPERRAASLDQGPATPETLPAQAPTPDVPPKEPAATPAEPTTSPVAETPEVAAKPAEEPHPEQKRYYRGVVVGGSETEKSAPSTAPIGPRARMFFKRSGDEKNKNRRRRS